MIEGISNIYALRENLKIRCEYYLKGIPTGQTKTLCSISSGTMCLYERIRRNQHCIDLYQDSIVEIIKDTESIGKDKSVGLINSIYDVAQDLSRIHPCAAALAWISISPGINLNDLFDDPFIPTDLSYSLILKAFRPVTRVCNYLTATGTYKQDLEKFKAIWNTEEYCNKLLEQTSKWVQLPIEEVKRSVKEILYI